jgi:hypothetical protein
MGEAILQGFFEIVCYFVGRLLLPIMSGGKWRATTMSEKSPRKWFERQPDGTLMFNDGLTSLVGLAFTVVVAALVVAAIAYSRTTT